MIDSRRPRPPPYNPSYNDNSNCGYNFSNDHYSPACVASADSQSKYGPPLTLLPPPPPERRCRSLPRRVHKQIDPRTPSGDNIDSPPSYDETTNPEQFHAIASVSRRNTKSRSRLPMSMTSDFFIPPNAVDLQRLSTPVSIHPGRSEMKSARSNERNSAAVRPVPMPRSSLMMTSPVSPVRASMQSEFVCPVERFSPACPVSSPYHTYESHSPYFPLQNNVNVPSACLPQDPYHSPLTGASPQCRSGAERNVRRPVSSSRLPAEKLDSSLTFVRHFGYGDTRQSKDSCAGLQSPRVVHTSKSGRRILVIDIQTMLVHLYSGEGHSVVSSAFKVVGVQGGCFWTEEKLVLATHRGIRVCSADGGALIQEFAIGAVVNTKPFGFGFVAVQQRQLSVFHGGMASDRCGSASTAITRIRKSSGLFRRTILFRDIADVATVTRQRLVVLDTDILYVIDNTGKLLSKIKPSRLACNALSNASSVTVDVHDNIIVSDSGNRRLLLFLASGSYASTLLSFALPPSIRGSVRSIRGSSIDLSCSTMTVQGACVCSNGELFVIVSSAGDCGGLSEVRVYRL